MKRIQRKHEKIAQAKPVEVENVANYASQLQVKTCVEPRGARAKDPHSATPTGSRWPEPYFQVAADSPARDRRTTCSRRRHRGAWPRHTRGRQARDGA
eukprot:581466-Pleurochrysis_carterae.AAC.3